MIYSFFFGRTMMMTCVCASLTPAAATPIHTDPIPEMRYGE